MKLPLFLVLALGLNLAVCQSIFAQAFGDYGRMLGGIPHNHGGVGPQAPGGTTQGGGTDSVENVGGRSLPTRLVVVSKVAGLYPRQDDEAEKLDQLPQGELLVPMLQTSGGNDWFMVKTRKGAVGWVKSADVQQHKREK